MYCQFGVGSERIVSFFDSCLSQGQVQAILAMRGRKHFQGIALQLGHHFFLPSSSGAQSNFPEDPVRISHLGCTVLEPLDD